MTQRSDDPKVHVTLRLRRSTLERLTARQDWRMELQAELEARYGKEAVK